MVRRLCAASAQGGVSLKASEKIGEADGMNEMQRILFHHFTERMKQMDGVCGAWNFGAAQHGRTDRYSDIDVVFLIAGGQFKQTEQALLPLLSEVCGRVLLCWEEDFNGEAVINNGYLLETEEQIVQFDIFLLNQDRIDDYMCRLHYTGLSEKDIIFDVNGNVRALCADAPQGDLWDDDLARLSDTYWYHVNMSAKYLLRRDYFKLNHVMRVLFDTHASLLLTGYDAAAWGGAADKLRFIPDEKQAHLKRYYCTEDFIRNRENLLYAMERFAGDLHEIAGKRGFTYDAEAAVVIGRYWAAATAEMEPRPK